MSEEKLNYFTLFGLPTDFNISAARLEAAYLTLQKNAHPDKFARADSLQRNLANQHTALVNLAYGLLKSPLGRAQHLLQLHNDYEVETEQTINDEDFLMEQMKWREEVEDAGDSAEQLGALKEQVEEHLKQLYDAYSASYSRLKPSQDAAELISLFHKMQYFTRLNQEITGKLL